MSSFAAPVRLDDDWRRAAIAAVLDLPDPAHSLPYRDPAQIEHFTRVAQELAERTGRPALAQAGFLHGLPPQAVVQLKRLSARGLIADAVTRLLIDRERLRDVDHTLFSRTTDAEAEPRLYALLARITSGASIVLLLLEQLEHLDPTGEGRAWLLQVYENPAQAGSAPRLRVQPGRTDREAHLAFAEAVLPFLARHFGFAQERRFVRDLVALHRDRQTIERVVTTMVEHAPRTQEMCDWLERHLRTTAAEVHSVRWEPRHLRSCQLELGNEVEEWPHRAWRCGFLSVVTSTASEAYTILGGVHELARADHESFRDYFSHRTNRSDYRAIHTAVKRFDGTREVLVRVRILTSDSDRQRREDLMRDVAHWGHRLFEPPLADNLIVVYTPRNEPKTLPKNALVLNFAASLNSRWVARVEGAVINENKEAGPFDVLNHGDTVRLKLRGGPTFLEVGWNQRVPTSTQKSLRDAYASAVAPLILEHGREVAMDAINKAHSRSMASHEIDGIVESALAQGRVKKLLSQQLTPRECLRQLGLHGLKPRKEVVDVPGQLDEVRFAPLLKEIVQAARPMPELDIPTDIRAAVSNVVLCGSCQASLEGAIVGSVTEDGVLTVHVPSCPEAKNPIPLTFQRRVIPRQYVTIGTTNRPGWLAEVCHLLRKRHVDVIEIIGRRQSRRWASVRLELDCPGGSFLKRLQREIESIPGVVKVVGPHDQPLAILEQDMPPRRDGTPIAFGTNPIVRNAPVTSDDQFYARATELNELKTRLATLTERTRGQFGQLAIVRGPLQTGKTSLLLRFLRELHRERDQLHVEVYLEARHGELWSEFEIRLARALREKVARLSVEWQRPVPLLDGDILEVVERVIRWTAGGAVVVAVDEVLRLANTMSKKVNKRESNRMTQVLLALRATPRCMVILAGPAARVQRIRGSLRRLLDNRSDRLTMGPFQKADVEKLIVAEKLPWTKQVSADPRVIARVLELTQGDPLWVGHLLHQLWKPAIDAGAGHRVRFNDPADVERAAAVLIADESCFSLRLGFLTGEHGANYRRGAFALLEALAALPDPRSVETLAEETGLTVPVAGRHLRLLAQAGLVRRKEHSHIYEIAAPILATYINTPVEGRRPLQLD